MYSINIKMQSVLILFTVGLVLTTSQLTENSIEVQQRLISEQIIETIEQLKVQMPCGFPSLGIPSLAPFITNHQNISVAQGKITAEGEINDFRLDGLDDFDIRNFTFNILTSKVKFNFLWTKIHLNTQYIIHTTLNKLALSRSGNATIIISDLNIWGSARYSLNPLSGHLKFKELKVYIKLNSVDFDIEGLSTNCFLNKKLNDLMEEWITLVINDNTEYIAEFTNELVMPLINNIISDIDMLRILLHMASNELGKPCIPPETDIL